MSIEKFREEFTIGDTTFLLTNTSMEYYGKRTGVSHLMLEEISDLRVATIVRFMKLAVVAEREACLKIAADAAAQAETWKDERDVELAGPIARAIENRIRARGAAKQDESE